MTQEETLTPEAPTEEKTGYNGLMIVATPEFKAAVKAAADEKNVSVSSFARQTIADAIGFTGPMQKEGGRRVRKYANEEERAAAQKARNKNRRDVIKALLDKYGDEFKADLNTAEQTSEEPVIGEDENED